MRWLTHLLYLILSIAYPIIGVSQKLNLILEHPAFNNLQLTLEKESLNETTDFEIIACLTGTIQPTIFYELIEVKNKSFKNGYRRKLKGSSYVINWTVEPNAFYDSYFFQSTHYYQELIRLNNKLIRLDFEEEHNSIFQSKTFKHYLNPSKNTFQQNALFLSFLILNSEPEPEGFIDKITMEQILSTRSKNTIELINTFIIPLNDSQINQIQHFIAN